MTVAEIDETEQIIDEIGEIELDEIVVPEGRLRRLRPEVVAELAQSMKEVGLLQPVLVAEDGRLIAGWHRIEAAKQLGWTTIRAEIVCDRTANLMRLMEIDENLARADLSPAERAAHQAERKAIYEREFPQTRHGGAGRARPKSAHGEHSIPRYSDHAAKAQGTSRQTVQREVARGTAIPNVAQVAGTALDQEGELDALAKLPPEQQKPLIERAKQGEKVSAKTTLKAVHRDEREVALAEKTAEAAKKVGHKLYGVVYADPPWRFEPWSRETGMDRAADNHYQTMTLDDIKALPVATWAADDCVLFLWATAPMLQEALAVMAAWDFTYKSHLIWRKDRQGTGYWSRNVHELLLVGTRGDVPAPAPGTQPLSVIDAPVGRHSEKPEQFAELIESLFPNAARLEMFARRHRPGWDCMGNEVDGEDQVQS